MIRYMEGTIFNSTADTLVNPVNTHGRMGKGLAKAFAVRFPEIVYDYEKACEFRHLVVGRLLPVRANNGKLIVCFPTKEHWINPSKKEWIELGLKRFVETWENMGVKSAAFPMLGCGNGKLKKEEIRPLLFQYLDPLPIHIEIYY